MARTDPQLNIRIPAALKDALDAVAHKNNRSTTAEIIIRLQSTFRPEQQNLDLGLEPLKDEIQGLRREMQSHQQWIESLKKSGANVRLNDQGQLTGFDFVIPAENVDAMLKRRQEFEAPLESVPEPVGLQIEEGRPPAKIKLSGTGRIARRNRASEIPPKIDLEAELNSMRRNPTPTELFKSAAKGIQKQQNAPSQRSSRKAR